MKWIFSTSLFIAITYLSIIRTLPVAPFQLSLPYPVSRGHPKNLVDEYLIHRRLKNDDSGVFGLKHDQWNAILSRKPTFLSMSEMTAENQNQRPRIGSPLAKRTDRIISLELEEPSTPLSVAGGTAFSTAIVSTLALGNSLALTAVLVPIVAYLSLTTGTVGTVFRTIGLITLDVVLSVVNYLWDDLKMRESLPTLFKEASKTTEESEWKELEQKLAGKVTSVEEFREAAAIDLQEELEAELEESSQVERNILAYKAALELMTVDDDQELLPLSKSPKLQNTEATVPNSSLPESSLQGILIEDVQNIVEGSITNDTISIEELSMESPKDNPQVDDNINSTMEVFNENEKISLEAFLLELYASLTKKSVVENNNSSLGSSAVNDQVNSTKESSVVDNLNRLGELFIQEINKTEEELVIEDNAIPLKEMLFDDDTSSTEKILSEGNESPAEGELVVKDDLDPIEELIATEETSVTEESVLDDIFSIQESFSDGSNDLSEYGDSGSSALTSGLLSEPKTYSEIDIESSAIGPEVNFVDAWTASVDAIPNSLISESNFVEAWAAAAEMPSDISMSNLGIGIDLDVPQVVMEDVSLPTLPAVDIGVLRQQLTEERFTTDPIMDFGSLTYDPVVDDFVTKDPDIMAAYRDAMALKNQIKALSESIKESTETVIPTLVRNDGIKSDSVREPEVNSAYLDAVALKNEIQALTASFRNAAASIQSNIEESVYSEVTMMSQDFVISNVNKSVDDTDNLDLKNERKEIPESSGIAISTSTMADSPLMQSKNIGNETVIVAGPFYMADQYVVSAPVYGSGEDTTEVISVPQEQEAIQQLFETSQDTTQASSVREEEVQLPSVTDEGTVQLPSVEYEDTFQLSKVADEATGQPSSVTDQVAQVDSLAEDVISQPNAEADIKDADEDVFQPGSRTNTKEEILIEDVMDNDLLVASDYLRSDPELKAMYAEAEALKRQIKEMSESLRSSLTTADLSVAAIAAIENEVFDDSTQFLPTDEKLTAESTVALPVTNDDVDYGDISSDLAFAEVLKRQIQEMTESLKIPSMTIPSATLDTNEIVTNTQLLPEEQIGVEYVKISEESSNGDEIAPQQVFREAIQEVTETVINSAINTEAVLQSTDDEVTSDTIATDAITSQRFIEEIQESTKDAADELPLMEEVVSIDDEERKAKLEFSMDESTLTDGKDIVTIEQDSFGDFSSDFLFAEAEALRREIKELAESFKTTATRTETPSSSSQSISSEGIDEGKQIETQFTLMEEISVSENVEQVQEQNNLGDINYDPMLIEAEALRREIRELAQSIRRNPAPIPTTDVDTVVVEKESSDPVFPDQEIVSSDILDDVVVDDTSDAILMAEAEELQRQIKELSESIRKNSVPVVSATLVEDNEQVLRDNGMVANVKDMINEGERTSMESVENLVIQQPMSDDDKVEMIPFDPILADTEALKREIQELTRSLRATPPTTPIFRSTSEEIVTTIDYIKEVIDNSPPLPVVEKEDEGITTPTIMSDNGQVVPGIIENVSVEQLFMDDPVLLAAYQEANALKSQIRELAESLRNADTTVSVLGVKSANDIDTPPPPSITTSESDVVAPSENESNIESIEMVNAPTTNNNVITISNNNIDSVMQPKVDQMNGKTLDLSDTTIITNGPDGTEQSKSNLPSPLSTNTKDDGEKLKNKTVSKRNGVAIGTATNTTTLSDTSKTTPKVSPTPPSSSPRQRQRQRPRRSPIPTTVRSM